MRPFNNHDIDFDQSIWRYMGVERLRDMLQSRTIHFAAATQFDDPFEGAVAVQPFDFPVDPRYAEPDPGERAFRELKRLTKISCWHREDHESDAMWQLYSGEGKGIAIVSNARRLDNSLGPYRIRPEYGEEDIWGGSVTYVDLMVERLRAGMMERFFYKHHAFSWEKEFRLAISVRNAEEFAVDVPEKGIAVPVDINEMIEELHIGPNVSTEDRERLFELCEDNGLRGRVRVTSLLGRPRYI